MTEKQYRKADAMVHACMLVVIVGTLLNMLGMLSSDTVGKYSFIVIIISILGIIATVTTFVKLKGKKICGNLMTSYGWIVWGVMVIFVNANFFYMLSAVIFIAQMAYLEKKRVAISSGLALPVFAIKNIWLVKMGVISLTEAGTSIVILLMIIISTYFIASIWIEFNKENLDTVRLVSDELVTHFDDANVNIRALDEALNTSSISMQDIAANIENTAQEILNQSKKCQIIENNTRSALSQTDIMVQSSQKALEDVGRGMEAMDKLHNHAKNVEKDNKKAVDNVAELNERTKAVQKILGTIMGISTRTHLLALNALVEANRAGDAGSGFAVVADEIKSLAEQTRVATEDIESIIAMLNEDVNKVTESINHSADMVDAQNALILESKNKFDAIDDGVNRLIEIINDFTRVIDGISEASKVISDGISELSMNSHEVAVTSNEGTKIVSQAVNDMNQVKETLNDIYEMAQNLRDEYYVEE